MLPTPLKDRAERHARKQGVSLAELIRTSLEQTLKSTSRPRSQDPFFSDKTVFDDDGPADLSENLDDYLYGEKR